MRCPAPEGPGRPQRRRPLGAHPDSDGCAPSPTHGAGSDSPLPRVHNGRAGLTVGRDQFMNQGHGAWELEAPMPQMRVMRRHVAHWHGVHNGQPEKGEEAAP